ncbi:MAG: AraC family transcriptional regulator, partial [Bacteroidales bacterium]|nr:AraC family transcriptional regulator [Bacteroidales bacterium]
MASYLSPQFVISITHHGSVAFDYDFVPMMIKERSVTILYPNHIVKANSISDDFNSTFIVISPALFDKVVMRSAYREYYRYLEIPQFETTQTQYDTLCSMADVMRSISVSDSDVRNDMLVHGLDVMVSLITQFRSSNNPKQGSLTDGQRLFLRFYDSVAINYKRSREVQFYANEFCLSAKYFGSLIRAETGVGAGDWIARYVVMQAKELLRVYPGCDIHDIARELGFDDQASFSRY